MSQMDIEYAPPAGQVELRTTVSAKRSGYDMLVLGGGSAGCVLASRLSEDPSRSVCLIEAGPDYGPYAEGRWPADLLYANELATSHDWGIGGGWPSWRARVIGGCSSHNGCFLAWGSPGDFDEWATAGNQGWSSADLEPYRQRALEMLRARPSRVEELEPFMRAGLDAAAEVGLPLLGDFDEPHALEGASPILVNAIGDVRWNAAFAYLDPARDRSNLTVMADSLVDRLLVEGDRATGALVRAGGQNLTVSADSVVVAAGAYGSPAILLRSGIGAEDDLARLSIEVRADVPGVGRNLADHPRVEVVFQPSQELVAGTLKHFSKRPDRAQTLIKARSEFCPHGTWDLQLMMRVRESFSTEPSVAERGPLAHVFVHALKPTARGRVRIASQDPGAVPIVDHGFLSDAGGRDTTILVAGIGLARALAEAPAMRKLLDGELLPGRRAGDEDLESYVRRSVGGYWHPVGTCKMGPHDDPQAVVDAGARIRGFANAYVVDASIMPTIPRANTHLAVIAVAERIADRLE